MPEVPTEPTAQNEGADLDVQNGIAREAKNIVQTDNGRLLNRHVLGSCPVAAAETHSYKLTTTQSSMAKLSLDLFVRTGSVGLIRADGATPAIQHR